MATLIVRHSPGFLLRNRKYIIYIDGKEVGKLSFRCRQLSFDLEEGIYLVTIKDRLSRVLETILVTDQLIRMDIYSVVSRSVMSVLLMLITISVLITFFVFLKDRQTSVQLLLLTILIPFYLVIFTSRHGAPERFFVSVNHSDV